MNNFMGFDGFIWWMGVVEDNNDPEQLGRVRVRCIGIHTEDREELPTEDLPWAWLSARGLRARSALAAPRWVS